MVVQSGLLSAMEEVLGFGEVFMVYGELILSQIDEQCELGAGGGDGRRAQRRGGDNEPG